MGPPSRINRAKNHRIGFSKTRSLGLSEPSFELSQGAIQQLGSIEAVRGVLFSQFG